MARVTPDEFVEKHARRLKGAVEDMRRGIERVTESPTAKAAAKKDKMRSRINEALDNGKWERGLRAVSTEQWKTQMLEKGLPRVSGGIDAAAPKVRSFASELLPYIDGQVEKVKRMPDLTIEDSINRMTTFVRGMSQFRKGK